MQQDRGLDADRESRVDHGLGSVRRGGLADQVSGVVDQDVDGAVGDFGRAGRQPGDGAAPAGQVGGHERGRAAGADDGVHHLGAAGRIPAVHDHLGARGRQGLRDAPADAVGGAGDQCGPAFECSSHAGSLQELDCIVQTAGNLTGQKVDCQVHSLAMPDWSPATRRGGGGCGVVRRAGADVDVEDGGMGATLTRKGLATRQRIVAGAAELFRARGVAGTSLDDVCRGHERPARPLFHYFPDGAPRLLAAVAQHRGGPGPGGPAPALDELTSSPAWHAWRDGSSGVTRPRSVLPLPCSPQLEPARRSTRRSWSGCSAGGGGSRDGIRVCMPAAGSALRGTRRRAPRCWHISRRSADHAGHRGSLASGSSPGRRDRRVARGAGGGPCWSRGERGGGPGRGRGEPSGGPGRGQGRPTGRGVRGLHSRVRASCRNPDRRAWPGTGPAARHRRAGTKLRTLDDAALTSGGD